MKAYIFYGIGDDDAAHVDVAAVESVLVHSDAVVMLVMCSICVGSAWRWWNCLVPVLVMRGSGGDALLGGVMID